MSTHLNRREFMKSLMIASASLGAGSRLLESSAFAADADPDRFLIFYFIGGGVDNHYWWDPKPKALTEANLKQNYLVGTDAELMTPVTDARGYQTHIASLTKDLWKNYSSEFSVLRGAYMSTAFDGHENNLTMLLTGHPLSADSFLPKLSQGTLLDFIDSAVVKDFVANKGGGANLTASLVRALVATNARYPQGKSLPGDDLIQQAVANATGEGLFAQGLGRVRNAVKDRTQIAAALNKFDTSNYDALARESQAVQFFPILRDAFRNRLTRVAIVRDGGLGPLDTHSATLAKGVAKFVYPPIVDNLQKFFKFLKETPYDDKRSLMDVCTVVVSSEFNRTYRSRTGGTVSVMDTGTDHNTLSNFVMIGGRGVKKGLICGETDLDAHDGQGGFANVSQAHHQIDPNLVKACGKPFDFDTLTAKPFAEKGEFKKAQHLHYNSVINTVQSLFDMPRDGYTKIDGTSTVAPVMGKLLV